MYFIVLEMAAVLQQSLVREDALRPMDDAKARENLENLDVPERTCGLLQYILGVPQEQQERY